MTEFSGSIGHMEDVESPWSNAGGVVKSIEELEAMAQTGVGAIEDGSHVILSEDELVLGRRLGNAFDPKHPELGPQFKVYDHDPETGITLNSLGMPGQGFQNLVGEIPDRVEIAEGHSKKYILNVAPVTGDPVSELKEMVQRGYEQGAHAVLVNGGCPNVILEDGGRKELLSRNAVMLAHVLDELGPIVAKYKPILLRLSPMESYQQAKTIYKVVRDSGIVSAVYTPNTWPTEVPVGTDGNPLVQVPGNIAGKSGPATADEAAEQARWAVELLRGSKIDVIRSGGINNANELARALNEGAAGGAGTTFFYEPVEGWADDTDKMLNELAA